MKVFLYGVLLLSFSLSAQVRTAQEINSKYRNWHNLDWAANQVHGISLDKAYRELLANKQPSRQVIVAVMDSGIDIEHEDLKGNIWVNTDEIAGNGVDDDQNGYIDDIHGWNFLGNSKGENIHIETYEFIRVLRNTPTDKQNTPAYLRAKKLYDKELKTQHERKKSLDQFVTIYETARKIIYENTGVSVHHAEDLKQIKTLGNAQVYKAKDFLAQRYKMGFSETLLKSLRKENDIQLMYQLNLDFDPRKLIGDNPTEITDAPYGNHDVKGPSADHGTAVAGVIAAMRNNNLGIDGIAPAVKIMAIRTTPDGDERDKDVALGIRYAVDNGAHIINMSFGKDLSPEKHLVDAAVKYAESKGVLIVHAAGNDGANIDVMENYPSSRFLDGSKATNWIEVGASDQKVDAKLPASFSNYGQNHVDVFAPGVQIASLDTANYYNTHDGTSLAAPVVTGVAAMIMAYYPTLTTQQVANIIFESGIRYPKLKVLQPTEEGKPIKVKFSTLSKTGSVINAYQALILAEKKSLGN